jgi:galactitol-specific phosphotransferase system IIB component
MTDGYYNLERSFVFTDKFFPTNLKQGYSEMIAGVIKRKTSIEDSWSEQFEEKKSKLENNVEDPVERARLISELNENFEKKKSNLPKMIEREIVSVASKRRHIFENEYVDFLKKNENSQKYWIGSSLWLADQLMKAGLKEKNLNYSVEGMKLYESTGKVFGDLILVNRKSVKRRFELTTKLDFNNVDKINEGREILKRNGFWNVTYRRIKEGTKEYYSKFYKNRKN